MAADVAAFIEGLVEGPALVAGWSMGGAMAQELALGWPHLVRGLALVATYHEGDRRADERFHAMLRARQALPYEEYLRLSMPWAFCYQTYERPGFVEDYIQRALALPHPQPAEGREVGVPSERLAEIGAQPSVGSVGDSYDNALAETVIGLYKTEVIHRRGPWRGPKRSRGPGATGAPTPGLDWRPTGRSRSAGTRPSCFWRARRSARMTSQPFSK